jgi:diguanylate cyclase (GGDEF)-like protein
MANVLVSDASTMTRILVAAYPPMSVFLLALGVRLMFNQGRRSPAALRLLVAALGLMLIGDVIYMLVEIDAISRTHLMEFPYAIAYICLTMAVLHPSMRMVTEPTPADAESPPNARLAIVAFALCVPAVVSVFPAKNDQDQWVLAVIVVAMTATAALRMFRALHEHANSEERLAFQATHDQLTGLPNRILIQQRLTHALAGHDAAVALLFIDVDRFKLVNDTMGHGTGDELLSAAARRLQATLRPHDIVGRGGGDEFLIVAQNVRGTAHALDIAERTRLSFATPFRVREAEIAVSASIGVAVQLPSGDPASAETMFRDADTAMYQAKSAGGDAVALFDSSVRVRIAERVKLER